MNPITIDGVRPSADLREDYRGKKMVLSYSRGKDSIAAWVAMREAGIEVYPYHMYRIPGLKFVDDSIKYYEDFFGTKILQLPHPAIYSQLRDLVFQPPERCAAIESFDLVKIKYDELDAAARGYFGLPEDTMVADGVRACDNVNRRSAITKHGPVSAHRHKIKIVWDWRKADVFEAIEKHGVKLPPDYQWFKRSFDGLDYRFMEPLSRHNPEDYQRVLDWFPLNELEMFRRNLRKPYPYGK